MKFRTTVLLAALLATAGCGGDDDSSGLLSPTAPSLVTGVAAQNDAGRQTDPQVGPTSLMDGMRAATAPATTIDFSSVTWSWNSAETHLEPSSIPDSRVQAGSNVWQRDDDTGLIRIFSDEDLSGWAFVTAGSSWSLSMRRPGLYVSNISAADVELIASGSGGSGGSGPRGEPGNRPRAACTLVYNYHDSSAYDGPLGHYVYADDGTG